MASTFYIKQDDTLPALNATLKDSSGTVVDLSGATLTFRFKDPDGVASESSASIVSATAGTVTYTFSAAQTDVAGEGYGEFVADFGGGSVQTFPTKTFIDIFIVERIPD